LSAHYSVAGKSRSWTKTAEGNYYDLRRRYGPCDYSSFYAYARLESAAPQRALLLLGSDDGIKVWHNGREVWAHPGTRGALPFQDEVSLDLQPGANDLLFRIQNVTGECGMYLHYRALGQVVARLPDPIGEAALLQRLREAARTPAAVGREFFKTDWTDAAAHGDAGRGRLLFQTLGCAKCHAISAESPVAGGPSLAEAGKRFTVPYLVESILLPSKQVSPVFRSTWVETNGGVVVTGLVVGETTEKLEMLLPDTTRKTLRKADIAGRRLLDTSPMPQGLVKTPAELRDLLAYLLGGRP
jgi:putative heme-binding domain-containing protein